MLKDPVQAKYSKLDFLKQLDPPEISKYESIKQKPGKNVTQKNVNGEKTAVNKPFDHRNLDNSEIWFSSQALYKMGYFKWKQLYIIKHE